MSSESRYELVYMLTVLYDSTRGPAINVRPVLLL